MVITLTGGLLGLLHLPMWAPSFQRYAHEALTFKTSPLSAPSRRSSTPPIAQTVVAAPVPPAPSSSAEDVHAQQKVQQAITETIATQYSIAPVAAQTIVSQAYQAAQRYDVDPLLLLALTAVESRFNPFAQSQSGATGLTQVQPQSHPDQIPPALVQRDPSLVLSTPTNLAWGAQVLHTYLVKCHGNVGMALQSYNGNLNDPHQSYSRRVFKALATLRQAVTKARVDA